MDGLGQVSKSTTWVKMKCVRISLGGIPNLIQIGLGMEFPVPHEYGYSSIDGGTNLGISVVLLCVTLYDIDYKLEYHQVVHHLVGATAIVVYLHRVLT